MPRVQFTSRDPNGTYTSDEEEFSEISEDKWMEKSSDDQDIQVCYSLPSKSTQKSLLGRFPAANKAKVQLPFLSTPVSVKSTEPKLQKKIICEEKKSSTLSQLADLEEFGLISPRPIAKVIPSYVHAPVTVPHPPENIKKEAIKSTLESFIRKEFEEMNRLVAEERKKKQTSGFGAYRYSKNNSFGNGARFENRASAKQEESSNVQCLNHRIQQHAVACASRAFSTYSASTSCIAQLERKVAGSMRKEFEQEFGGSWKCIVGPNFYSHLSQKVEHLFYFRHNSTAILLFKCTNDHY